MILDHQLFIREKSTQQCRMCGNAEEVCRFLEEINGYRLTPIEFKALDGFMQSVLPLRDFQPYEKRRTLLLVSPGGEISELAYKEMEGVSKTEAVPEGYRMIGQIFAAAYTRQSQSVARFDLGTAARPVTINLSRKSSTDALHIDLAEELWSQQIAHFRSPDIPNVKADLSRFKGHDSFEPSDSPASYTLRAETETFHISGKEEMVNVLQTMIGHEVAEPLRNFLASLFLHFDKFPKGEVFSPGMEYFCDIYNNVYVGGDGTSNRRKLVYAGKFFPAFFSGMPGNLFSMKLGIFEDAMVNLLLVRN